MFQRVAIRSLFAVLPLDPVASAQSYPTNPVRIIPLYSLDSLGDLASRAIATALMESMGQQFLVDNRPGASQGISTQAVTKSVPDGYTMVYGSETSLAINPAVTKDLSCDPVKDFTPVSLCVTTPLFLAAHPSMPLREPEAA